MKKLADSLPKSQLHEHLYSVNTAVNALLPYDSAPYCNDSLTKLSNTGKVIYSDCPHKCISRVLINRVTGSVHLIKCKSYSCEFCGDIKRKRLLLATKDYLSTWNVIRMFTFTVQNNESYTNDEWYKLFAQAWSRFMKEVRRNPLFSTAQRTLVYLKFHEAHLSGKVHYHVFINQFMPIKELSALWRNAVHHTFGADTGSNIDVVYNKDAEKAAGYVAGYVNKSKSLNSTCSIKIRRFTKSERIALFPKLIGPSVFECVSTESLVSNSILIELCTTAQEKTEIEISYSTENAFYTDIDDDLYHYEKKLRELYDIPPDFL